jgi:hypothetical protein
MLDIRRNLLDKKKNTYAGSPLLGVIHVCGLLGHMAVDFPTVQC